MLNRRDILKLLAASPLAFLLRADKSQSQAPLPPGKHYTTFTDVSLYHDRVVGTMVVCDSFSKRTYIKFASGRKLRVD